MAPPKLPVSAIQSKVPWFSGKPHNVHQQPSHTAIIKANILEETLKPALHRYCLCARINMPRKTPQADGSGLNDERDQPNKRLTPCAKVRYGLLETGINTRSVIFVY